MPGLRSSVRSVAAWVIAFLHWLSGGCWQDRRILSPEADRRASESPHSLYSPRARFPAPERRPPLRLAHPRSLLGIPSAMARGVRRRPSLGHGLLINRPAARETAV